MQSSVNFGNSLGPCVLNPSHSMIKIQNSSSHALSMRHSVHHRNPNLNFSICSRTSISTSIVQCANPTNRTTTFSKLRKPCASATVEVRTPCKTFPQNIVHSNRCSLKTFVDQKEEAKCKSQTKELRRNRNRGC